MLFDCDPTLIKRLAKEQKVGVRDVAIKPKAIGPNDVTCVSAKSMRGVEFVKKLEEKIPKIVMDFDMDDSDEDMDDSDEDMDDEDDSDEDDLEEEDEELEEG